jgi:hypothetical protein
MNQITSLSYLGLHKYLDNLPSAKTRAEPFQTRAIGLRLIGRHLVHSQGGYSNAPA